MIFILLANTACGWSNEITSGKFTDFGRTSLSCTYEAKVNWQTAKILPGKTSPSCLLCFNIYMWMYCDCKIFEGTAKNVRITYNSNKILMMVCLCWWVIMMDSLTPLKINVTSPGARLQAVGPLELVETVELRSDTSAFRDLHYSTLITLRTTYKQDLISLCWCCAYIIIYAAPGPLLQLTYDDFMM